MEAAALKNHSDEDDDVAAGPRDYAEIFPIFRRVTKV